MCVEFEPILLDRALTDSQLRTLIEEASEILKDRRRERIDPAAATEQTPLPGERGGFMYEVRTSYFPHIKGHAPVIYRLEPHDGEFVAVQLASRTCGSQRPTVMGRFPAKNGEVFKIVRENGEYSYQVPFNGTIHNLKRFADLSCIGIFGLEALRPFLECVEPEAFERITGDSNARLNHTRQWLDEYRDQVGRWRNHEFWANETPANKREYRQMLKEAEEQVERLPNRITEKEAFVEWLKGIDRSDPMLRSVPPPPAQQRKSGKR